MQQFLGYSLQSGISSSLYLVERVVGYTWVQAPPGLLLVVGSSPAGRTMSPI